MGLTHRRMRLEAGVEEGNMAPSLLRYINIRLEEKAVTIDYESRI